MFAFVFFIPIKVHASGSVQIRDVSVVDNKIVVTANVSVQDSCNNYELIGSIIGNNPNSAVFDRSIATAYSYIFNNGNNQEIKIYFDDSSCHGNMGFDEFPDSNYEIACTIMGRRDMGSYIVADQNIASTSVKKYISFHNGISVSNYNPSKTGDENANYEYSHCNIASVTEDNEKITVKANVYAKGSTNFKIQIGLNFIGNDNRQTCVGSALSPLFSPYTTTPITITFNKTELVNNNKGLSNGKYNISCILMDTNNSFQYYPNGVCVLDSKECNLTFPAYIEPQQEKSQNSSSEVVTKHTEKKKTVLLGKKTTIKLLNSPSTKIKWSASNKKIKIVKKSKNKVTILGVKRGKTTLTAKVNGKKYKCKITISDRAKKTGTNYVLNTSTMKFHYPSCKDVKRIKAENYETSSDKRSTLISQGYSPCGHCKP